MAAPTLTYAPTPYDRPSLGRRRPNLRRPALILLALACVLFLGFAARIIPEPFGDSHDGRNAGVWAAGSRSLLERGPVESRLGTRSPENGVYANHPPLLYVETALFEAVGGSSAAASRAPAWLGTLAALGLLTAILLQRGLHPSAVGVAVVLVAATPMLLVYGAMLDTPVASLPFGLAVLFAWDRARDRKRVYWPVAVVLTALAVLAGWQSLLVAAVVGGWAAVRLVRRSGSRTPNLAFAGGALLGAVGLVTWLLWAFGGTLGPLFDQLRMRTGQTTPIALRQVFGTLGHDTLLMFGITVVLATLGLVVALADRRTRALAVVALAVTLPYPLIFRSGTVNHDYWNFWFLLPIAIGLAAGFDRLTRARSPMARRETPLVVAAAILAIVLTASLWVRPNQPELVIRLGASAGTAARSRTLPANQGIAWYTGGVGEPAGWLALATRRQAERVPVGDLAAFAAAHPEDMVLVGRMECVDGQTLRSYAFETAAALAARPPHLGGC